MEMFHMRLFLAASTAALCLAGCSAQASGPASKDEVMAKAASLMDQGLRDDVGLKFVEDLTTEIGPRLAGSPAEAAARDWSMKELKELGFQNVRVEPFDIPYWERLVEMAEIIGVDAPNQPMYITALGGSAATPDGGVTAELVRYTSMAELEAAPDADVAGKIVFIDEMMTRTQDGSGYGMAVGKRRNCAKVTTQKGGAACLIRSVGTDHHRFPHTGMMARGEATGPGPAAAISPPDADQLARLLERRSVSVKVNIQVDARRAAPSGNVLAEITGRTNPEEIVLIGCHLDSWDLGTGAVDDGAGCGIVVGAAKLIMDSGKAPKRTIRVVLYGAEEVGLLGANAYAEANADDLANHILASESDFGAGKIWRFQTRFGDGALDYAAQLHGLLAPLGVGIGNNQARGGPDIGILARAGVPVVTPAQNGLDYFDLHHTPDDTFDKIVPEDFRQNVAVYAGFVWVAAESGWDFRQTAQPETIGTE